MEDEFSYFRSPVFNERVQADTGIRPHKFADKKGENLWFYRSEWGWQDYFLRLVTGLAFPTSGTLSLWGKSETVELQKQRKRIGSMIETPALFPAMTAYQNMEIQRIQRGIPDKTVIKRTLDMVGLNDTGKRGFEIFP